MHDDNADVIRPIEHFHGDVAVALPQREVDSFSTDAQVSQNQLLDEGG